MFVARTDQAILQKCKRGHLSEYRSRFAVGNWSMKHQRTLRFTGENAMNAMSEFVRECHHVSVRSQIIHKRVRYRLSSGQNVGRIKSATPFFFRNRRVDAAIRKKSLHKRRESWAETFVRGCDDVRGLAKRNHRGVGEQHGSVSVTPAQNWQSQMARL